AITVRREWLYDRARTATVETDGAALEAVAADRGADSNADERLLRPIAEQRREPIGKVRERRCGLDPAAESVGGELGWPAIAHAIAHGEVVLGNPCSFELSPGLAPRRARARERNHARGRLIERSEEHTSELQSRENLVCRLLLE